MDKKGVVVEGWKARRKEWKKKRWKKGKKWFWEKSFFCFCLTVCLPLPFFPLAPTTTPHTRSHSPTTRHTTLHIGAHHHMQTEPCAVLLFWEWTVRHTASPTHHTPSHDITQHTPTNQTQTHSSWCNSKDMTAANEKGIGQRAKVGQHSSTNTLIEVATTQWL